MPHSHATHGGRADKPGATTAWLHSMTSDAKIKSDLKRRYAQFMAPLVANAGSMVVVVVVVIAGCCL